MNNEQMIQLLRKRRHHDLNHLQLIKLFNEIEDYTNLKVKLTEFIDEIMLEQRLFNLSIPQFALFMIQFNHEYNYVQLTYNIDIEKINLADIDQQLMILGNHLKSFFNHVACKETLYYLHIDFYRKEKYESTQVKFNIKHLTQDDKKELKSRLKNKQLNITVKSVNEGEMTILMNTLNEK